MKSVLLYCLVFFAMLYIMPAQTIIYEKDYPIIPDYVEKTLIFGCNIDSNSNLQVLGYSKINDGTGKLYNYFRLFDKDLNLINHIYIDTNSTNQFIFFDTKLWRFTTTTDGNHYFYAHKIMNYGFGIVPCITSKEISKDWKITKDTLMIIRTDSFDIETAIFTSDTNMINFGFSNLDSIKHHIMVQKTDKDNNYIWTKHYNLIDTAFYDMESAYAFSAKDSNMLLFYKPFYRHLNPDSSISKLYYTHYARFSKEGDLIENKLIDSLIDVTRIAVDVDRIYTYYRLDSITYKFECWDLEMNNIWSKELEFSEYYSMWLNDHPIINSNGEIIINGTILTNSNSKDSPIILKYDSLGNKLWEKVIENNDITRDSYFQHLVYDGKNTYIGINRKSLNITDAGLWKVLKFTEDETGLTESVSWQELSCSPNPFSESTRIDFSLEHASKVNIKVMNLKGEAVFSTEYFAESGEQHYNFNGSGLVSGTYYIEINTPNNKYHTKAVLQK